MLDRATRENAGWSIIAGLVAVIGSYAAAGLTPRFVAAPIDTALAHTMPGPIMTFAIENLGDLGQQLNFVLAIVIATALISISVFAGTSIGRHFDSVIGSFVLTGGLVWVLVAGLTGALGTALGAAVPAVGVIMIADWLRNGSLTGAPTPWGRRRVVITIGGLIGIGLGGYLVDTQRAQSSSPGPSEPPTPSNNNADPETVMAQYEPDVAPLLEEASRKSLPIEGIEPLVSEEFYEVDINSVNPNPNAVDWTLTITGAVEHEETITYPELIDMEVEHRFVTLRCVGEQLNGHKMDNAVWTGVSLRSCLNRATPLGDRVMLRAADGYFEEFGITALENGFLAFGMNGKPLPRAHGHPVRALIPGHWGEINVKWLTEIEVLNESEDGYWEQRGWHGTGPVNTVAKIHAANHFEEDGTQRIQIGGHAYAGTRGIERVEVSLDDGNSWTDTTISDPLPGEDVWRQWTYEYESPGEIHRVIARAIDGTGAVQPKEESGAFPSGPSGWVSRDIRP